MKSQIHILTLDYCWKRLDRLLPHGLKTFKILDCMEYADSDESRKPCQALDRTQQSGIVYGNILSLSKIAIAHISSVRLPNTLKRAFPDEGTHKLSPLVEVNTNTGCRNDLFQPLERNDGTNDRRRSGTKKINSLLSSLGVGGNRLVFSLTSKTSLSQESGFDFIV